MLKISTTFHLCFLHAPTGEPLQKLKTQTVLLELSKVISVHLGDCGISPISHMFGTNTTTGPNHCQHFPRMVREALHCRSTPWDFINLRFWQGPRTLPSFETLDVQFTPPPLLDQIRGNTHRDEIAVLLVICEANVVHRTFITTSTFLDFSEGKPTVGIVWGEFKRSYGANEFLDKTPRRSRGRSMF